MNDYCCRRCADAIPTPYEFLPTTSFVMVVCTTCGNKRCPHATDHRLTCTGSNEPGQAGSWYA